MLMVDGSRPAASRSARTSAMASVSRPISAPTAKVTRSASRAARAVTLGPVAATSMGTGSWPDDPIHSLALVTPSRSTGWPCKYPRTRVRYRSNTASGAGFWPRNPSEESPRPIPSTARPPDATCTEVMADAATAGCRVTGFVTPVANPIFEVAVAAIASDT